MVTLAAKSGKYFVAHIGVSSRQICNRAAPPGRRRKWRHLSAMSFLDETQTSRRTIGSQEEQHDDCALPCEVPQFTDRPSPTPTPSTTSLPRHVFIVYLKIYIHSQAFIYNKVIICCASW